MLALRLQRTGRKKISHYRVIAQEHKFQPTSGKVTAFLGHYNPYTKEAELDVEQIEKYLKNGARPSDAAAKLFKKQGIKLPDWVSIHEYEDKPKQIDDESETTEEPAAEASTATAEESETKENDAATEDNKDSDNSEDTEEEETADDKSDDSTDSSDSSGDTDDNSEDSKSKE